MFKNYKRLAVVLFGWVPDEYPSFFESIRLNLRRSGLRLSLRSYVSMICLTALISYVASFIASIFLLFFVLELNIFLKILALVFFPFITGVMVFIFGIYYPHQRVMSRRKNVETNLPFAVAHMGAIAASGIPPSMIFKLLSEFKEYEVLAEEMGKIDRNVETFGLDPLSSIREVAKRTPSDSFEELLFGVVSTIESGGDLRTYLKNAGEQSLFTWRMKREKYLQQLSAYAEFYTGLLIAAPLFIIALFSVMNMIQPQIGGFGILELMKMSIYLLVPALNVGFLLFLKVTHVEM